MIYATCRNIDWVQWLECRTVNQIPTKKFCSIFLLHHTREDYPPSYSEAKKIKSLHIIPIGSVSQVRLRDCSSSFSSFLSPHLPCIVLLLLPLLICILLLFLPLPHILYVMLLKSLTYHDTNIEQIYCIKFLASTYRQTFINCITVFSSQKKTEIRRSRPLSHPSRLKTKTKIKPTKIEVPNNQLHHSN